MNFGLVVKKNIFASHEMPIFAEGPVEVFDVFLVSAKPWSSGMMGITTLVFYATPVATLLGAVPSTTTVFRRGSFFFRFPLLSPS